jgi:hypothetical protein
MKDNNGNGYFGRWTEGLYGTPAYLYECNQIIDDKSLTMTNEAWNGRRNHIFVIGNDRIVATCSNYGYIQARQDERCPKYLNDYDPKRGQFGGGFGYLKSDSELITTYYTGQAMRREYGAGYMRKVTSGKEAEVEDIIFAPYGDEPVLLKRVRIKSLSDKTLKADWYDYFGAAQYQYAFTHYCAAQLTFNTANVSRFRRRLDKDFKKSVRIDDNGLRISRAYKPTVNLARMGQASGEKIFAGMSKRFHKVRNFRGFDDYPPDAAYYCLSKEAEIIPDSKNFFGAGGAEFPDYFKGKAKLKERPDMHMLKSALEIKTGEQAELVYIYAYEPEGYGIEALREKYIKSDFEKELNKTLNMWKSERVSIKIPGEEWIDRELMWHNAYLRGSMTYSEYFKAHILSQGGHYQYLIGLQGAPRDQLQHALPFIYTEPYIAREHILFTLREMSEAGELPYATHGYGMMVAAVMVPSDLQLMLLNFVAEYVMATRDYEFLNSEYYTPLDGWKTPRKVIDGVMLAYRYVRDQVGRGEHGLVKMKTGDWNDQAVYGRVPFTKTKYAQKHGESMLNSTIAIHAYRSLGEMLRAYGRAEDAAESLKLSSEISEAVSKQWNGNWFKRAWMGEKLGWLGDDLLWLEPQPWAFIGGATNENEGKILAENIRRLLSNPNGSSLISHSENVKEDSKGLDEGTLENGGIWPAVNGYLVWGLSKVNGEYAYEEWLKNSRFMQAEAYPEIWYGIWSGPDSVNASYAKYPGRTQNSKNPYTGKREKFFKLTVGVDWEDFPVLNLHAHTWQQYSVFKLLGAEFTSDSLILCPVIPKDSYEITSRLLSVKKNNKKYEISYNPVKAEGLKLVFINDGKVKKVSVQGKETSYEVIDKGIQINLGKAGEKIAIEY